MTTFIFCCQLLTPLPTSTYLNDDVGSEPAWPLLLDVAVDVVEAEVELELQLILHLDIARVRPTFPVHFATENSIAEKKYALLADKPCG